MCIFLSSAENKYQGVRTPLSDLLDLASNLTHYLIMIGSESNFSLLWDSRNHNRLLTALPESPRAVDNRKRRLIFVK